MNRTVLIVDDEARYRDLYARVLRDAGFDVRQAEDVPSAMKAMGEATPMFTPSMLGSTCQR